MTHVDPRELYEWCRIPADELPSRKDLRVPFRMLEDSAEMGKVMAAELVDLIEINNSRDLPTRAIVPCGPTCWYDPWCEQVNARRVSLKNLTVFHMDECLDWQGRLLPKNHPYNFRTFMEEHFYGPVDPDLNVPERQRYWLEPGTAASVAQAIEQAPIHITYGGWGQDGHINNIDTILALAQRTFGSGYQFVPPMSITLGVQECLSGKKVRVFSDTGAWKQTALRVALFSDPTPEYPMTLLQEHPDALITATRETARHPISENPNWELF